MANTGQKKHGGARAGAGRKPLKLKGFSRFSIRIWASVAEIEKIKAISPRDRAKLLLKKL